MRKVSSLARMAAVIVTAGLIAASCSGDPSPESSVASSTSATGATAAPASAAPSSTQQPATTGATIVEPIGFTGTPGPGVDSGASEYLFDQERLHTFELRLSEDSLAFLDADPAAEEYVEGELFFEGEPFGPVGIRYKGSIGAFVGCVSGTNFTQPSGEKTCTKLSMKVKINWDDPNREFYGVRKLQFHSQNLDLSLMHERLGYWLFREMGVPAPRSVHARIEVNSEFVGLFAFTEQIDGRFARENFADGTGNLYKEVWPITSGFEVQSKDELLAGLKTNEDENPSVDLIQSLARAVLDADDAGAVVDDRMDINEVLSLAVVDRTIRNDDGPFHWYCQGFECAPHNFFFYEDPTSNIVHLIPWDLDNAFQNIVQDLNPVTPIRDGWGEISRDCDAFPWGSFNISQRSAACDPLIGAWAGFEDEYDRLLIEFAVGPFSDARVTEMLTAWENQIADVVAEADAAHADAPTVASWRSGLETLRQSLDFARDKIVN